MRGSWRCYGTGCVLAALLAELGHKDVKAGGKVMPIPGDAVTQIRPVPWKELVSPVSSDLCEVLTLPVSVQVSKLLQLYFFLSVLSSLL